MKITQFEHLIEEHGLHHLFTIASQLRFIVLYADRYDTLAFGRDEFLGMTAQEADRHIDACKSRLERAAPVLIH